MEWSSAPIENPSSSKPNAPSSNPRPSFLFETPPRHPSSNSRNSKVIYSDRFIPSRIGSNFSLFDLPNPTNTTTPSFSSSSSNSNTSGTHAEATKEENSTTYSALLRTVLFGSDHAVLPPATPDRSRPGAAASPSSSASFTPSPNRNIFRYKAEIPRWPPSSAAGFEDMLPGVVHSQPKAPRKVPRSPYKVLDAPALQDDFYLNLVDWSSHNVLAVGLGNCVYLWNACSSKVTKLCDLGVDDSVCSVGWAQRGTHLAVGTNLGKVQIWDASRCRRIRTMEGHRLRVGALAWSSSVLSSGSRDKSILQRDIRAQEDYSSKLTGHKSEVCGLKWSYDNRELASGGNDNRLFVWNQHSTQPVLKYCEHTAAVKAIAWSPHLHGLLASGGGTADRCIRFWNTTTNSHLSCMDTGSQVCNLVWSKNVNELVSTHGYSQNQIIVWRYPAMSKLATLTGHTFRVLYLAISPDGQTIVTGAGDETLRFWNVFPSPKFQSFTSLVDDAYFSYYRPLTN
ncbi:protein FIZZY-RELATED 2-like [Iris pallida]|uniref:Protein FIZZY-RELATED 2-like n=1 Tax=Iris pallida TaxID=29817 RepID=A0AAX6E2L9_IRIPA|nr:protein FIZZY-RELATED 2-like [Iris pallida]KAJ6826669.1 protein FIZZY-RELATED 2-like [Iris pallida]